ncbi:unnamed protein product, partial [Rotaria magnacalcarata]
MKLYLNQIFNLFKQQHRQAQVRPPQQPQAQAPQQAQRRLHRRQQAQRLQPYIFAIQ